MCIIASSNITLFYWLDCKETHIMSKSTFPFTSIAESTVPPMVDGPMMAGMFPEMAMGPAPGGMQPLPAPSGPLQSVDRIRNVFPETWLWSNFTATGYTR